MERKNELTVAQASRMARAVTLKCLHRVEDLQQKYPYVEIDLSPYLRIKTPSVLSTDQSHSRNSSSTVGSSRRNTNQTKAKPKTKATPKATNQSLRPRLIRQTREASTRLSLRRTTTTSNNRHQTSYLKPGTLGSRQQVRSSAKLPVPGLSKEKQINTAAIEIINTNNIVDESIVCSPVEFCQRANIKEVPADIFSLCKRFRISVADIELAP